MPNHPKGPRGLAPQIGPFRPYRPETASERLKNLCGLSRKQSIRIELIIGLPRPDIEYEVARVVHLEEREGIGDGNRPRLDADSVLRADNRRLPSVLAASARVILFRHGNQPVVGKNPPRELPVFLNQLEVEPMITGAVTELEPRRPHPVIVFDIEVVAL